MSYHENANLDGIDAVHRRPDLTAPPYKARDFGFALFGVFAFTGVFMIGWAIDEPEPPEIVSAAMAEREWIVQQQRIRDAYAEGQRQAVVAIANTPRGLELAQMCMASGYRRQP